MQEHDWVTVLRLSHWHTTTYQRLHQRTWLPWTCIGRGHCTCWGMTLVRGGGVGMGKGKACYYKAQAASVTGSDCRWQCEPGMGTGTCSRTLFAITRRPRKSIDALANAGCEVTLSCAAALQLLVVGRAEGDRAATGTPRWARGTLFCTQQRGTRKRMKASLRE